VIDGYSVGVDVHGEAGGGVAEAVLNGLDVGAVADHESATSEPHKYHEIASTNLCFAPIPTRIALSSDIYLLH